MDDGMTIWANWTQILNWVYFVGFSNFRNLFQVMNMNEIFSRFSVYLFKIETANLAGNAIMFNALSSCFWVSFISIDRHPLDRTFKYFVFDKLDFFGEGKPCRIGKT